MSTINMHHLSPQDRAVAMRIEEERGRAAWESSQASRTNQTFPSYQTPSPYQPGGSSQMQMIMALLTQMMQSMSQLGGGFSNFLGGPQQPYQGNSNYPPISSPTGYGGGGYNGSPGYQVNNYQPTNYKPTAYPVQTPNFQQPAPQPPAKKGGYA